MTFQRNLISILALSVLISTAHWSTVLASTPTYTPIITEDFEGYNNGDKIANNGWPTRSFASTARPYSGNLSGNITIKHGGEGFGFNENLPQSATVGDTIWYRAYFYFPSTLSFSAGDKGGNWGFMKFLMLSKYGHQPPRVYVDPPSPYMKNYGDAGFAPSGIGVETDQIMNCNPLSSSYTLPRDQWFSLQMAFNIQTSGGWMRVWSDETFLGQCNGNAPSGYTVQNWGIGDWINGGGWIQGASTDTLWIDNVAITKQEPNSVDSGGRPFIHPSHFTGNLQVIADPNPPTQVQ